jgi:hypothetical protein
MDRRTFIRTSAASISGLGLIFWGCEKALTTSTPTGTNGYNLPSPNTPWGLDYKKPSVSLGLTTSSDLDHEIFKLRESVGINNPPLKTNGTSLGNGIVSYRFDNVAIDKVPISRTSRDAHLSMLNHGGEGFVWDGYSQDILIGHAYQDQILFEWSDDGAINQMSLSSIPPVDIPLPSIVNHDELIPMLRELKISIINEPTRQNEFSLRNIKTGVASPLWLCNANGRLDVNGPIKSFPVGTYSVFFTSRVIVPQSIMKTSDVYYGVEAHSTKTIIVD